jgi:hypothetical protein
MATGREILVFTPDTRTGKELTDMALNTQDLASDRLGEDLRTHAVNSAQQ